MARQKLKSLFDSRGVKGKDNIEILDDGDLEELWDFATITSKKNI